MMLADRDLIDQLVDKRRFQALAARHDLPVPPAQHLRPAPGDPPPALDVPYPVGRQAAYADPGVGCSRRLWQGAPRARP